MASLSATLTLNVTTSIPPDGRPSQTVGSVYGEIGGPEFSPWRFGVVSGTVTIRGNIGVDGTFTYQWTLNGNPVSPVLTGPASEGLPWEFDTTTTPDGTYIIYPIFLDWDSGNAANTKAYGTPLIIANHGASIAAGQLIPCAPLAGHRVNARPDFIMYDGVPNPVHNTYPMPYNFSPPTSDRNAQFYAEVWPGPRSAEYYGAPQWTTLPGGGVHVEYLSPLVLQTTERSYEGAVKHNTMDGTRLNALVSPYSNFVEDPNVSGQWWGAEINGRIFKLAHNGTVTTIFGPYRDRARLSLDRDHVTSAQTEEIRLNIGTYPAGVDALDGANDLCFDPRDHNILYVAAQLKHFIARINLTTLVCTVYCGVPETPGYVDGASTNARFNMPTSIIMAPSGIMYISDQDNSAIRMVSADGITVNTLCGGTVGPTPPTYETLTTFGAIHNISGPIVWNAETNTGPVTLSAPASLVAGQMLMQGNNRFIVATVIDSTHLTITVPGYLNNPQNWGTIPASITLQEVNMDVYSSPGTVSFANAYVSFPNVIRFTSTGNIVVGESVTDANRLINLATSTITRIGCFGNRLETDYKGWYWLDVDSAGTCGPVDDIMSFKVQDSASAAHYTWRSSLAVSSVPGQPVYSNFHLGDGPGPPSYGAFVEMGFGHYPWAIAISRKESRFISTGMATWGPTCYRLKQPSDPVMEWDGTNFANSKFFQGLAINENGTVPGFPWASRPGFYNIWGKFGATFIGNGPGPHTFEDLMFAYPTDDGLASFIQSGMGGAVPRPELTGNDLRDYIYFVRRGTLQGSLGPTPIQPGPDDPDKTPPVILTLSASRLNSTSIKVSWTTDEPTIGLAGAGSTNQALMGSYPMYSDIENGYGTSHTATITVPSNIVPIHYTVVAKDRAGNIVHTDDRSIT